MSDFEPRDFTEDRDTHSQISYCFYPTWRSQVWSLLAFFSLSVLAIVLSRYFPVLVVPGKLFTIGSVSVWLSLPVLLIIPGAILVRCLIQIYNAKYIIDESGVEAQIGLVSLNLRQPRLRWEDIRGSEPRQSITERMLGIGDVLIGSAMKEDVVITMAGVANPGAVQMLLQSERERRLDGVRGADAHARATRART